MMGNALKARREVFTLLHHGVEVLHKHAPGGVAVKQPLDGGVELLELAQSLRSLPLLCLSSTDLSSQEIHSLSEDATRQVVSWVTPTTRAATGGARGVKPELLMSADQALGLLDAALSIITTDLRRWVDGELDEEPLTVAMIAGIFRPVPYQVQDVQDGVSSGDVLVELLKRVPSESKLARVLEATGILPATMLKLLLEADLESTAKWFGRKQLMHPNVEDVHRVKISLLDRWVVLFPEKDVLANPVTWFGHDPAKTLKDAKLLATLNSAEEEVVFRLAKEFNGTAGELLECARSLS